MRPSEEEWKPRGGEIPSGWGDWGRLHGGSGTWMGLSDLTSKHTVPSGWRSVRRWTWEVTSSGQCDHMCQRGTFLEAAVQLLSSPWRLSHPFQAPPHSLWKEGYGRVTPYLKPLSSSAVPSGFSSDSLTWDSLPPSFDHVHLLFHSISQPHCTGTFIAIITDSSGTFGGLSLPNGTNSPGWLSRLSTVQPSYPTPSPHKKQPFLTGSLRIQEHVPLRASPVPRSIASQTVRVVLQPGSTHCLQTNPSWPPPSMTLSAFANLCALVPPAPWSLILLSTELKSAPFFTRGVSGVSSLGLCLQRWLFYFDMFLLAAVWCITHPTQCATCITQCSYERGE